VYFVLNIWFASYFYVKTKGELAYKFNQLTLCNDHLVQFHLVHVMRLYYRIRAHPKQSPHMDPIPIKHVDEGFDTCRDFHYYKMWVQFIRPCSLD
jgi:hypothetical protein